MIKSKDDKDEEIIELIIYIYASLEYGSVSLESPPISATNSDSDTEVKK